MEEPEEDDFEEFASFVVQPQSHHLSESDTAQARRDPDTPFDQPSPPQQLKRQGDQHSQPDETSSNNVFVGRIVQDCLTCVQGRFATFSTPGQAVDPVPTAASQQRQTRANRMAALSKALGLPTAASHLGEQQGVNTVQGLPDFDHTQHRAALLGRFGAGPERDNTGEQIWNASLTRVLHYAILGVALPRDDIERQKMVAPHRGRTRSSSSSSAGIALSRFRPRRDSYSEGVSNAHDGEADTDETEQLIPDLALPKVEPSTPTVFAESFVSGINAALNATREAFMSSSVSMAQQLSKLTEQMRPEAAPLADSINTHVRAMQVVKDQIDDNEHALPEDALSPEELAVLKEKMAAMEAVLKEELVELREQEVNVYVEKFQQQVQVEEKLAALEEALLAEQQELEQQQRWMEIERFEREHFPEPVFEKPEVSGGDDDFTLEMRQHGLRYKSSAGTERQIQNSDLPPPLDLSAL